MRTPLRFAHVGDPGAGTVHRIFLAVEVLVVGVLGGVLTVGNGDVVATIVGLVAAGIGTVAVFGVADDAGHVGREHRRRHSRVGGVAVRGAGRLLPAAVRQAHVEEWQGWLYDMREQAEPWYRRLAEVLSIVLIAAPRLAVTARLANRRVVD
jgi:hypothetical protein